MAVKFCLEQMELQYLLLIFGAGDMSQVPKSIGLDESQIEKCKQSLIEKGYMGENENSELQILNSLAVLVRLINESRVTFSVLRIEEGQKVGQIGFYFHEGKICFVEQKGRQYELAELPSIPLMVGILTSRIEIENKETEIIKEIPVDQITDELEMEMSKSLIGKKWVFMGKDGKGNDCLFTMLETDNGKVILELKTDKIVIKKPGKTELAVLYMDWMDKVRKNVEN